MVFSVCNQRPVIGIDFDGTLVSCREKQIRALQKASKSVGLEYCGFEEFWKLKCEGSTTVDALYTTGVARPTAEAVAKRWVDYVETWDCLRQDRILPGALDALDILSQHADLLLLSGRRDNKEFEREVAMLGIAAFFKHRVTVFADHNVASNKSECLKKYRARCYIGDTESDLAAAKMAKIPVYLVSTGQRSEKFLRAHSSCDGNARIFSRLKPAVDEALSCIGVCRE